MSKRKDMSRFLLTVVILSVFVPAAGAIGSGGRQDAEGGGAGAGLSGDESELRWDLAEEFGFAWDTVTLSALLQNTAGNDEVDCNIAPHELTISVKLDIYDTNDLVGMAVNHCRILELLHGDGKSVRRVSDPSDSIRQYVEVKYVQVVEEWHMVYKLQPSEMTIQLYLDPNDAVPSVLSEVKGYVYALYAEDVIEIDIPFEPVGQWIDVAPDLEIQVEATTPPPPGPIEYEGTRPGPPRPTAPLALYDYTTLVRSKTGEFVRGLADQLEPDEAFEKCVVMETRLYDSGRGRTLIFPTQQVRGCEEFIPGIGAFRGANCDGWTRQNNNSYDMIRHVIAVRPREVKIPFTLASVPVPSLEPTGQADRKSN
ncbi:MAG: hypothetical protein ACYTAO_20075, partial [Planctomycetota bacterium]|jgi:hypothetical protein